MQTNNLINITVGDMVFKTTVETVMSHESYISNIVKYSKDKTEIFIDRDPLCFPIIMNYLRGYTLKESQIIKIYEISELSMYEFFSMLHDDICFYGIKLLIDEFELFLYNRYPLYMKNFDEYVENKNPNKYNEDKTYMMNLLYFYISVAEKETEDNSFVDINKAVFKAKQITMDDSMYKIEKYIGKLIYYIELCQCKDNYTNILNNYIQFIYILINKFFGLNITFDKLTINNKTTEYIYNLEKKYSNPLINLIYPLFNNIIKYTTENFIDKQSKND